MQKSFKSLVRLAVLSVLTVGVNISVRAQDAEQLTFFAKVAPTESRAAPLVVLRWDVLEGQLPAEIVSFEVRRGEELLSTLDAHGARDAATVQQLYQQADFRRQRAEMLYNLQRQAAAPADLGGGAAVTAATLGAAVIARAAQDPLFAFLAPRQDIVAAVALNRGYIDRPDPGVHAYELRALDANGRSARVGRVSVDTARALQVGAAADFAQIRLGRCDAPESGLDDGAIALNWRHGGDNPTQVYANSLQISGYELWRSHAPLAEGVVKAPPRDIAALTQGAGIGPHGAPVLPELHRLNEEPIVLSGALPVGDEGAGNGEAQFVQTAAELARQGMKPGTRWAYYLVPRDFSGQYGPTLAHIVTVPDLLRPPMPWNPTVTDSSLDRTLALEWDAVNLANYLRAHQRQRNYCNLDSAVAEGRLFYAPDGQTCAASDVQVGVNLRVSGYRVYRFDQFDQAAAFSDRDGDGVADAAERSREGDIGSACDAGLAPRGAPNHRIDTHTVQPVGFVSADGRQKYSFVDPQPVQPGRVWWYRVAAVGANGQVSVLSPPLRAMFPERELPAPIDRSDITLTAPETCRFRVNVESLRFGGDMVIENSPQEDASHAEVSCGTEVLRTLPFKGAGPQLINNKDCLYEFSKQCPNGEPRISYYQSDRLLASASLGSQAFNDACPLKTTLAADQTFCQPTREVAQGERLDQVPDLQVNSPHCVVYYRHFGDRSYRVANSCNDPQAAARVMDVLPANEPICLSVAAQNANGLVSPQTRLPCFTLADSAPQTPPAPSLLSLDLNQDQAQLVWILPAVRLTGSIVELTRIDDGMVLRQSIPATESSEQGVAQTAKFGLPTAIAQSEQWCLSAKTVGVAAIGQASQAVSPASASLCTTRSDYPVEKSRYLPWPPIPQPLDGEAFEVVYFSSSEQGSLPALRLGRAGIVTDIQSCQLSPEALGSCGKTGECLVNEFPGLCVAPKPFELCETVRSELAGKLDFVVYRQSRKGAGTETDFVQVSPLIDRAFCNVQRDDQYCPLRGDCPVVNTLQDPFIQIGVLPEAEHGESWRDPQYVFVDRYPHREDRDYRYQAVYFDTDGEIRGSRTSGWLPAQVGAQ
ncbi:hypothetical protein [Sinimarinibacterium sp. NLF-5-8]|uniref:hypothetical protein n=1 Tax=Sinimarinibacterium sp. NLF-5-8 TaxID=2698684 RepID=UPI00137C1DBD|nr:hypothetical protein [Sinimarinibacterium sp. NLF-5-8]QHS11077.1 hypothetical protein GT972_13645 [Sinimarinibacterium sp. NLF-5-8]